MSDIAWVRTNYQVPAKVRGRVRYTGGKEPRLGTITAASGRYLLIRMDGDKRHGRYHPTWCIEYLPNDQDEPLTKVGNMDNDPECFGNYNKINSCERAENDCLTCPVLYECAKVPNPIEDAFRAGWNACEGDAKRKGTVNGAWYAYRKTL